MDENPGTFDGRQFANVSFVHGGQTYRVLPYSFRKRLRVSDFPTDTGYYMKAMDCIFSGGWGQYSYKVYWTGAASMRLDSVYVTNDIGRSFDSLAWKATAAAAQRIVNYYDVREANTKNSSDGFYIADEILGIAMKSLENIRKIVDNLPVGYPKRTRGVLGAYNNPDYNALSGRYYDTYIEYTSDSSFMFDYYPNHCWQTPSSESNNLTNWQRIVDDGLIPQFRIARDRAQAISQNKGWPVSFGVVYPTFNGTEQVGSQYITTLKMWSKQQMRCAVNVALSAGAKSIGYWLYTSHLGCQPTSPPNFPKTVADVARNIAAQEGNYSYSPVGQDTLCSLYPSTCPCSSTPTCGLEGLVDIDAQNVATPNSHWHDYRETNLYLDSMAYFFNSAAWLSSGRWTANIGALTGSFIDSVKSLVHFHNDSAYLQVSFFSYQNENYAFILNRRADSLSGSWPYARIDTQSVRVFFKAPREGAFEIQNIYANTRDTIYDSSGVLMWNCKLDPGAAVLIKRRVLKQSWAGNLTGNWTWPRFSTIRIPGDLTIAAGSTVTANSPSLVLAKNSDSLASGYSSNQTEIIVNGTLRLAGTSSSVRTNVTTTGTGTFPTWYGIRTSGSGKVVATHAYISNAFIGLLLNSNSTDSVLYSRIDSCQVYGIDKTAGRVHCISDTFLFTALSGTPSWQGIFTSGTGSVSVRNSAFRNAYVGLNLGTSTGYDTIISTRIDSCALYGIRKPGGNLYCYADTLLFLNNSSADSAVGILTQLSNSKIRVIRKCLIDGYWTGIVVRQAPYGSVVIDSSTFRWSPTLNTGSVGVKCGILANPLIRDCEFDSYWHGYWGSPQGFQSRLERCRFYSDTLDWNYMMEVGVLTADTCTGSSCDPNSGATTTVRQCCFRMIRKRGVWMARSGLNLGINLPADSGKNVFNYNSSIDNYGKVVRVPDYAIYNSTALTMSARGNYWSGYAPANWFFGSVDTSGGRVTYAEVCNDPAGNQGGGGNEKLANTMYVVKPFGHVVCKVKTYIV